MTKRKKNEGELAKSSSTSAPKAKIQKTEAQISISNTKRDNLFNQITIISNREDKFNQISKAISFFSKKVKSCQQKKKSVPNTKKANLFNQTIISNVEDATQKLNHISRGKSVVALSNDNTDQMDFYWKAKGQQKKKSVANTKKANLFNQTIISNGEDAATQKFDHISKGQSVVDPSNDNTGQMDVDRATDLFQDEILMEILNRLPVRSLLRFKCVSNIWKTLISEPYFKMTHLNCAKNDQGSQKLLINQRCPKDDIMSLYCCPLSHVQQVEDVQKLKLDCPSNLKPTHFSILCCYDGLAVMKVSDCDRSTSTLLLWNPSTRESIVLPPLEFPQVPESRFGLGYDSTRGEYNILRIYQDDIGRNKLPNEILALKSGSWRRIAEHPRGICSLVYAMQSLAFVHATFHWIAISSNHFVVVSFGISNEVYGEIPLAEEILSLRPGRSGVGVFVLGGMLCVHSNTILHPKNTFKVWVLKEYGVKGSWMPLLIVEGYLFRIATPNYRFADGEVLFCCRNIKTMGFAFMTSNGPFVSWPRCDTMQYGCAFTESLISPKSLTY